jgi:type IV secretory pathway VirB9-like protein
MEKTRDLKFSQVKEARPMEATVRKLTAVRKLAAATAITLTAACLPIMAVDQKAKTPVAAAAPATPEKYESTPEAKTYRMSDRQSVTIQSKVQYDTWIVLPSSEVVMEAGTGDPENWQIRSADEKRGSNVIHVKPAVKNSTTNMHLLGSSGHIYSFVLREISSCESCKPDLKVFVEPTGDDSLGMAQRQREAEHEKEVTAKINLLTSQLDEFRAQARTAKESAALEISRATADFQAAYPLQLRCDYQFEGNKAPFMVSAICSDQRFTYIKSGAREMPSLYIFRDGKPALVQFKYFRGASATEGTYVINSVITSGYLALGKQKLAFRTRPED